MRRTNQPHICQSGLVSDYHNARTNGPLRSLIRGLLVVAILATSLSATASRAAADTPPQVTCATVMQSIADIIPIQRCDTSQLFPDWMTQHAAQLGQRPLSQVALVGAHDALMGQYAPGLFGAQWVAQTQDLNLWGLLQYGARAFDMRFCTPADGTDVYYGCHGGMLDTKVTPAGVINDLRSFTNAHAKEILIVQWNWTSRGGTQALQDALCQSVFDEFRDIIVPPAMINGNSTLNQIWSLSGQPRIILNTTSCAHYFSAGPQGGADTALNWTNFYGGQWADSPYGDLDPNLTGQCHISVDVEPIVQTISDLLFFLPAADRTNVINALRGGLGDFFGNGGCTDVATANTLDLTSTLDPAAINVSQAVLTDAINGIYAATVGTVDITNNVVKQSEFPAVWANLFKLWKGNLNGARPRVNVIMGDFIENNQLVQKVMGLNVGPLIATPTLINTADGTPYTPGPGSWSRGVTATFDCTSTDPSNPPAYPIDAIHVTGDDIAGEVTGPAPLVVPLTAAMQHGTLDVTCADTSGKLAKLSVAGLNIDPTAPYIATDAATADLQSYFAGDWTNQAITVTFTCVDDGEVASGVSGPGVETQTIGVEGAAESIMSAQPCHDLAGNSAAAATFGPINIDTTPPSISAGATTADGHAYGGGWTNQNVTVAFVCADTLSLVASCPVPLTRTTEGASQSVTGTATDNAGNTQSATFSPLNIDQTPPVVAIEGVSQGATYARGKVPAASCGTADALAGVAAQARLSVTGGNAQGVGLFIVTCASALDRAGNRTAPVTLTYTVQAEMYVDGIFGARVTCFGKIAGCFQMGVQIRSSRVSVPGAVVAFDVATPTGVQHFTATTGQTGAAGVLVAISGPGRYIVTVTGVSAAFYVYTPASNSITTRVFELGDRWR